MNINNKPYSDACDNNKRPILEKIRPIFSQPTATVLEIGSGTGQHAVYFGSRLPHLTWQTSDLLDNHEGILQWLIEACLENVLPPIELDVSESPWDLDKYDGVFSANTSHIMSWPNVVLMMAAVGNILQKGGKFCLYGPFNYAGNYTSESNASFDVWLKDRDPLSGIRDFEALDVLAKDAKLALSADHTMPVNNRLLVWEKEPSP